MTIYNSFIVSNFNHCSLTWHLCSASSTNKIATVQERILCFINNEFTPSLQALLTSTNTILLYAMRMKKMAAQIYQIVNDSIAPDLYQRSSQHKKIKCQRQQKKSGKSTAVKNTRYRRRSFHYEAVRI